MVEDIPEDYAVTSGFLQAGVLTVSGGSPGSSSSSGDLSSPPHVLGKKKGKGRKQGKSPSSTAVEPPSSTYTPVPVPSSEELMKVYKMGLATAD